MGLASVQSSLGRNSAGCRQTASRETHLYSQPSTTRNDNFSGGVVSPSEKYNQRKRNAEGSGHRAFAPK
jgi:hypothetical protein